MAKYRKKKREEEKFVWRPPEFDEKEFMEKEVRSTKATVITFLYALGMSAASFGLTLFGGAGLGFLLGLLAIAGLFYILPMLGAETEDFEKKDWAGQIAIFFFAWLGVWILICNPPFWDFAEPDIRDVEYLLEGNEEWNVTTGDDVIWLSSGENLTFHATITDNTDVRSVSFKAENYNGTPVQKRNGDIYEWQLTNLDGNYNLTISATDKWDNVATSKTYRIVAQ